jgi:internalin A
MSKIRIVIVDDEASTREMLRIILSREPDMEVVGEAGDGTKAESIIQQTQPDVVILDIVLSPGPSGFELAPIILQVSPNSKLLMISGWFSSGLGIRPYQSGAGFLSKLFSKEELIFAIRTVANDWWYLPSETTIFLLKEIDNPKLIPNKKFFVDKFLKLDLSSQALNKLPIDILEFSNLSVLDIEKNAFSELPPNICIHPNLKKILAGNNLITDIPAEIKNKSNLEVLDLRNNKLNIPPEILERINEPQVILDFYFTHLKKALNEFKLLIVGESSVGKTSLVQRIGQHKFDPNQIKTEGISITSWQTQIEPSVKLNIWDFGGQEIMHATHQFFLTKRSLYLLVVDSRNSQEQNRVEYWLKIIQSFGGESPVLIVGNKIDQHLLDIDRTGLQKKYPNIVGILETSAATGAGIETLKAAITEQVNNLPHVRDLLPETWFTVKTKLEELGHQSNFITHDKYLELCTENEVSDETSQRTLIGFLHDLGVVLHFQDDPRLEALGILNPQWVTNGVYKILNSHTLFQNKGVLTVSMLDEILNLPEYPRGVKRLFIVDMMKKFELCYDIEPDKTFLVPDLLPKDEPAELKFNGVPAFEYAYPVLPSSVITRFIVRMNQKIDDDFVWRTGILLKIGENKALVKADIEDRKITIAIDGLEHTRRDALSAIRYQLDEIHASIKGLNPEKFAPIPGAESQRYEFLLQLEHDGLKMLPVPGKGGGKPIMVDISQLLSGIESEAQRRESVTNVTTIYNVNTGGGDFTGRDKSVSAGDHSTVFGGNVKDSTIIADDDNEVNK